MVRQGDDVLGFVCEELDGYMLFEMFYCYIGFVVVQLCERVVGIVFECSVEVGELQFVQVCDVVCQLMQFGWNYFVDYYWVCQ